MRPIDNLQLINKTHITRKRWRIALLSLSIIVFSFLWTGCNAPKETSARSYELTLDERKFLKEFFCDLLFGYDGAYTLFGTKPVSLSLIQTPATDEEIAEWNAYYESLPEEEKTQMMMRKKRYDFPANYHKWQEIKHRFPIRQYLFGTFLLDDKTEIILFVNIEMTIRTLLEYYDDFRRVLGLDFDPLQVVFEVENSDSPFWKKVAIEGHSLLGILLGYGRDNAWFFEWNMKYEGEQNKIGNFFRTLPSKFDGDRYIRYPDPQDFPLPIFKSFGLHPNTQLISQYRKEQKQIKKLYRGKDDVDVALDWLTR